MKILNNIWQPIHYPTPTVPFTLTDLSEKRYKYGLIPIDAVVNSSSDIGVGQTQMVFRTVEVLANVDIDMGVSPIDLITCLIYYKYP